MAELKYIYIEWTFKKIFKNLYFNTYFSLEF